MALVTQGQMTRGVAWQLGGGPRQLPQVPIASKKQLNKYLIHVLSCVALMGDSSYCPLYKDIVLRWGRTTEACGGTTNTYSFFLLSQADRSGPRWLPGLRLAVVRR